MRDDYEAYVEVRGEFGRMVGGTREEVESFWKRTEGETGRYETRFVLQDGTVLEERAPGSPWLRRRVARRLADEHDDGDDTLLIRELAELLGVAPQ